MGQNRGSAGEGIWIIKLKSGEYCSSFGEASCTDDEVLDMMEANDNHAEEHTVAEFIEFCVNGRSDKSGEWTSQGVGPKLVGIIHKKPKDGGISAVGGTGSTYTYY